MRTTHTWAWIFACATIPAACSGGNSVKGRPTSSSGGSSTTTSGGTAATGTGGTPTDSGAEDVYPGVSQRHDLNFNLDWKYNQGDVTAADVVEFDDSSWVYVDLPHTTRFVTLESPNAYQGVSWYRKHFTVSDGYRGSKIFLEFEAAMQEADVWVNGSHKSMHYAREAPVSTTATHQGGYTPFTLDITHDVVFGDKGNVVSVKLDNRAATTFPPGQSSPDFQYHGGLYRDVSLHVLNPVHVTDAVFANDAAGGGVFITYPSVASNEATVAVKTNVANESSSDKSVTVTSELFDETGQLVRTDSLTQDIGSKTDSNFTQSLVVENPLLWHPDSPHLYALRTRVNNGTSDVDSVSTPVGIRSIAFSRASGLTINGAPYKTIGVNMHQEMYGLGNAVSKASIYYDVKRIKDGGMNFIRASHYPHSTAFYDACDKLGILVLAPQSGWQYYKSGPEFDNNSYQELRDMIRRDRNHPSIIAWEASLNESNYTDAWAQATHAIVHQEYPGDQAYSAQWSLSRSDISIGASQSGIRSSLDQRPIIIDEYGDWEFGQSASTSRQKREDGDNAMLIQASNIEKTTSDNLALSWYSLGSYWDYADYAGFSYYGITRCGIVDMYRLPKFGYYFLQSQRNPNVLIDGINSGPMVFIANQWMLGSPTTVRVYSNCDKVSLYLNDALVATQSPDSGTHLWHPPTNFVVGTFLPGTLRATCHIGGIEMAQHRQNTPAPAAAIELRPEATTLQADSSDTRLIFIDVVDTNGTVVPNDTTRVKLSVTGAASIIGPDTLNMKGGQLATWVRAGRTAGTIMLTATAAGLTSASVQLTSTEVTGLPSPPADR